MKGKDESLGNQSSCTPAPALHPALCFSFLLLPLLLRERNPPHQSPPVHFKNFLILIEGFEIIHKTPPQEIKVVALLLLLGLLLLLLWADFSRTLFTV